MQTLSSSKRLLVFFIGLSFLMSSGHAASLDGGQLSLWWAAPFVGILLSIALFPLLAPQFWHHHFGKISFAWAALFLVPFIVVFGIHTAAQSFVHVMLAEYIPFVVLLTALYTISGGIYIKGSLNGTPKLNTCILALGAVLASIMGTTGAAMLLIRPLLRANENRNNKAHIVVFFIFIVANIGGSLSPLGDPPLFLGFLKGVTFFWPLAHLWSETLFTLAVLLVLFFILDTWLHKKEQKQLPQASPTKSASLSKTAPKEPLTIEGAYNFIPLAGVIGLVLLSGLWKPEIGFNLAGTQVNIENVVRDIGLILLSLLSLRITAADIHQSNQFSWLPMQEVAKLFAGIFLTITPVIAMLQAGLNGPFSMVLSAMTDPQGEPIARMYFWATGLLSGFLDNAPTYLVFYNSTGADATTLMSSMASTLSAISAGAVFMGALSYIGNAPNLMVKAIAEDRGVKMPSFFGYIGWSFCILLPLFFVVSLIWY